MKTRKFIIEEIKRTAASNGGLPLGIRTFEQETSIKPHEWQRYWARFGDAQKEAGFEPNIRTPAIPDNELLKALALLTRELGHRPTTGEIRVKKHSTPSFPSVEAVLRLGDFKQIEHRLVEFCRLHSDFADITALFPDSAKYALNEQIGEVTSADAQSFGYCYMLKFRRNDYKIGASKDPERRFGEIATKMPEKPTQIHTIKTDDPFGVEAYWHRRFSSKQSDKNSEWFQLSSKDVAAFKRWRRIY